MWQERNKTGNKMKDKLGIQKLRCEKVRGEEDGKLKSAGGRSD